MTEKSKQKTAPGTILLDPNPKGTMKVIAGAEHDEWNLRQANLVLSALPGKRDNEANAAIVSGMVDMKPTDPVEGILISQIAVTNEAALSLYRRAWACDPNDYFEAHMKYLQLADKASRTVAMLTERLDHHRGRGQQQIVVKRVNVNADQAVVTDTIVTGRGNEAMSVAKLLTATTDEPMETVEPMQREAVPMTGGGKKAK
jgi:hypothetical protein